MSIYIATFIQVSDDAREKSYHIGSSLSLVEAELICIRAVKGACKDDKSIITKETLGQLYIPGSEKDIVCEYLYNGYGGFKKRDEIIWKMFYVFDYKYYSTILT